MDFLVLTKTGGVFGPIAEVLGWIMEALFAFTEIFGIVNIGLCIILFTLVTKLILFPLTLKQQKSSKIMAVMQPEIQAIQKKYKDKKDNESMMKMNVETREVYEKYGTSMTGGCLPLLIQLPIMLALYQVIYKIPAYVHSVRQYFDLIIEKLPGGICFQRCVYVSGGVLRAAERGLHGHGQGGGPALQADGQAVGPAGGSVSGYCRRRDGYRRKRIEAINRMQQFLGMNIAYTPLNVILEFFGGAEGISVMAVIFAVLIPVLSGLTQWYSTPDDYGRAQAQANGGEPAPGSDMKSP